MTCDKTAIKHEKHEDEIKTVVSWKRNALYDTGYRSELLHI